MKQFKLLVVAILLAIGTLDAQAAQAQKNLFVTLTTDAHKPAGMGLSIAYAMQDAGVNTTVLIGADAVDLALAEKGQHVFGPMNKTPKQLISDLIKKGGRVMVCGMCAKFVKIDESELVRGVRIVNGSDVYGALFAPDTRTLSF